MTVAPLFFQLWLCNCLLVALRPEFQSYFWQISNILTGLLKTTFGSFLGCALLMTDASLFPTVQNSTILPTILFLSNCWAVTGSRLHVFSKLIFNPNSGQLFWRICLDVRWTFQRSFFSMHLLNNPAGRPQKCPNLEQLSRCIWSSFQDVIYYRGVGSVTTNISNLENRWQQWCRHFY